MVDAVVWAADAGDAGMEIGQELATIQMPPNARLSVIVKGELAPAVGAGKAHPLGMAEPHIDSLLGQGKFHPCHQPRRLQTEQVPVEFDVAHGPEPPSEPIVTRPVTHRILG